MAKQATELELLIKTTGVEKLRGLTSSLKRLKDTTVVTSNSTAKLLAHLKKQSANASQSINRTQALANSYRQLAKNVDITSKEFREATAEANRLEKQLRKMQSAANKGMGGRLKGAASTFGAIGAAGIFGGPEGFAGSAIGGVFGGAPGAIAGGVIGSQIGMARKGLEEIATYNAALGRQRKALKLVINDSDAYAKAQQFLADTSQKLAIPQNVITRQFTALTASVVGAGHSVEDAQDVFLSITSGIRGTGGSIEDMNAALRATAQVFSKGKVSAEELRQQLGERLPGAFTLFAASMDKTPAELDKALEQGKVTLNDFLGFSKHLFANYGKNAEILSKAPEAAGDRLAVEIAKLKETFGGVFTNIGALFQDNTTKFLKFLNDNSEGIKLFIVDVVNVGDKTIKIFAVLVEAYKNYMKTAITDLISFLEPLKFVFSTQISLINLTLKGLNLLRKATGKAAVDNLDFAKEIQDIIGAPGRFTVDSVFTTGTDFEKLIAEINKVKDAAKTVKKNVDGVFSGVKSGMQSYVDSIQDFTGQVKDATVNAFKGMEDALVNFVTTGKLNFADLTRSILADITRIIIRQTIITPLLGAFGITTNATGNVYDQGLKKFAKGGIVTQPTLFAYGSGGSGNFGLMGEAGAEAILPLKRGRSGNLGVEASGGATNIVVNVDASGSSVEGDEADGKSLGLALSAAIESELIKQKRPGGLLA